MLYILIVDAISTAGKANARVTLLTRGPMHGDMPLCVMLRVQQHWQQDYAAPVCLFVCLPPPPPPPRIILQSCAVVVVADTTDGCNQHLYTYIRSYNTKIPPLNSQEALLVYLNDGIMLRYWLSVLCTTFKQKNVFTRKGTPHLCFSVPSSYHINHACVYTSIIIWIHSVKFALVF